MARTGDMENRHRHILEILSNDAAASVTRLADSLHVSKETIRKDLQILASAGKITRIHGGAALIEGSDNMPFRIRKTFAEDEKRHVAKAAGTLIEKDDTLIIEGGTVNVMLCNYLLEHKEKTETLTIITNSLRIAQMLGYGKRCRKFFLLGGQLDAEEGRATGSLTISMLDSLHADKTFISAAALDKQLQITAYKENDMRFQKKAIQCADKTYVLINKSKYPSTALFTVCKVSELTGIVTDIAFDHKVLEQLNKGQVEVVQA